MKQANGDCSRNDACPACGSADFAPLATFGQFPAIIFPVEELGERSVRTAPLCAEVCQACGHLFLSQVDPCFAESLYSDYYHFYPYKNLESMRRPYREPFERIIQMYFSAKTASLLEIGCDDVGQMRCFLDRGYSCTAINPGAQPHKDVRFIDGFYGKAAIDAQFDYIVSRFNLEHILNLEEFFEALDKNLASGGVAVIQVPNAEQYLRSGLLNVFMHEHAHYFCQSSLLATINRRGYQVLHISDRSEPSLICAFCRPQASLFSDARPYVEASAQVLAEIRQVVRDAKGRVFLYGAGLSLSALLYDGQLEAQLLGKITLLDDNPLLWGRFMPNTRLKIVSWEESRLDSDSVVVLMLSEQYQKQVREKLSLLGVACEISAVTGKGLVRIGIEK